MMRHFPAAAQKVPVMASMGSPLPFRAYMRQWKRKKSKTDKFKSDDGLQTGENLTPHREGGKGLTIRDERGRKSESLESESEKVKK